MINKQSNVYTIVYITAMVIVVGAVLAFTSMALKDRQEENAQADKKSQILQAVHISTTRATVIADFEKYIVSQLVVNDKGEEVEGPGSFLHRCRLRGEKAGRPTPAPRVCMPAS